MRPPALPTPPVSSPGTAVPRISGSPVSANSTNNTKSGVPMGGFPNIFPTVSTSMPPAIAPSVTSNSKQSALAEPFISSFIMLAFIGTWNHILNL
ncbi:hypothetical protein Leryth_024159 [Lithospermum erythrorhizon]|nr:hypothetical protein Leryth_024159 [Lithospermum erythrorhizon]